jgi:hypothetical protein
MPARTWYVSCSPRSPEKIAPEIELLQQFEGINWNEQDENGRKIHQIAFAEALKSCESFEGKISEKEPDFSARDRIAPMKTYGFAYQDSEERLRITEAGRQLIRGERIQELFLKQMLKWQYPSYQFCKIEHSFNRYKFRELLDSLFALGKNSSDSNEWTSRFDVVIECWKSSYQTKQGELIQTVAQTYGR